LIFGLDDQLNEDKILDFFKRKIRESGFPFQNMVGKKLREHFVVQHEILYVDKDESKTRTMDLRAYAFIPDLDTSSHKDKPIVGQLRNRLLTKQ